MRDPRNPPHTHCFPDSGRLKDEGMHAGHHPGAVPRGKSINLLDRGLVGISPLAHSRVDQSRCVRGPWPADVACSSDDLALAKTPASIADANHCTTADGSLTIHPRESATARERKKERETEREREQARERERERERERVQGRERGEG